MISRLNKQFEFFGIATSKGPKFSGTETINENIVRNATIFLPLKCDLFIFKYEQIFKFINYTHLILVNLTIPHSIIFLKNRLDRNL